MIILNNIKEHLLINSLNRLIRIIGAFCGNRINAGAQGRRDAGAQGRRGAGTQGRRDAGTQGRRDAGAQGRRDAGAQGRRGAGEFLGFIRLIRASCRNRINTGAEEPIPCCHLHRYRGPSDLNHCPRTPRSARQAGLITGTAPAALFSRAFIFAQKLRLAG